MGLFNRIIKKSANNSNEENNPIPWNVLNRIEQLDVITELSKKQPVAIFKHSTRCGISRMVLRQFEKTYNLDDSQMKLYYLDLLNFRNISDEVGYRFQVMHQSPQLIVIKDGIAIANASHNSIDANELQQFV